jgi:hypothetical protein
MQVYSLLLRPAAAAAAARCLQRPPPPLLGGCTRLAATSDHLIIKHRVFEA